MAVKSAYVARKGSKGEKVNLTNSGFTTEDFSALRLGDASRHADQQRSILRRSLVLELSDQAKFGKDLIRCFFADMAGVEDYDIGVGRAVHRRMPAPLEEADDPRGVVDVHLAAVGLYITASQRLRTFSHAFPFLARIRRPSRLAFAYTTCRAERT